MRSFKFSPEFVKLVERISLTVLAGVLIVYLVELGVLPADALRVVLYVIGFFD